MSNTLKNNDLNQFNWTYLADNGKRHQVTLMHGARTGHLLVYCNTNILLIDFKVLKTSTYSFFIEEELCELTIEREGDQFSYGFELNREANTPLNQKRRLTNKKHLWQSLLFLGGLMLMVSIFIVGITHYQNQKTNRRLEGNLERYGRETTARILMNPEKNQQKISYFFFVNGQSYSVPHAFKVPSVESSILLETGMPLEAGDEFLVRYLPSSPQFSQIDFSQPNAETLQKYKDRALIVYQKRYPEDSINRCTCLVELAYELKGVPGLADFYFSNTDFKVNKEHNTDSFLRLIRDLPFQEKVNQKCAYL